MSNRILMGSNVVLLVVVVTMGVFTMTTMNRNNQVIEAMMLRMEALQSSAAPASELGDWCRINIRVNDVEGNAAGEGYRVWIKGDAFDPGDSQMLNESTDGQGQAQFGPIRPGSYTLHVWDQHDVKHQRTIIAYPGIENAFAVQWRRIERDFAPLELNVSMPDVIRDHVAFVWLQFQAKRLEFPPEPGDWEDEFRYFSVFVDPDGGQAQMTRDHWPFDESRSTDYEFLKPGWSLNESRIMGDITRTYQLNSVKYFFRVHEEGSGSEQDRFPLIKLRTLMGEDHGTRIRFDTVDTEFRTLPEVVNHWHVDINPLQGQRGLNLYVFEKQLKAALQDNGVIPPDESP